MPSEDRCQQAIIRALLKEGWLLIKPQFIVLFHQKQRRLYIDLHFARMRDEKPENLLVEVKCFNLNTLDEFYASIGQYQVYRHAMDIQQIPHPLYLAVPHHTFRDTFLQDALQKTWQNAKIKIITVDLKTEKVRQWIH